MRQALFDEFQQIEWQARVEAIRERLDDQRRERQEQEEAQEQAEREAAAQHEHDADRQAAQDNRRVKMALALQWHGDRLLPGEHRDCDLAFITSLDEVVIAMLISGGENATITRRMFNALRDQIDPTIAAISTCLIAVSIGALIGVRALGSRGKVNG